MCAITGYYKLTDTAIAHEGFITQSLKLMKHRAPDAVGTCAIGTVGELGHGRLSIIDTRPSANQPMQSTNSSISFNGEIYNYQELIPSVGGMGALHTHADTEVLQRGLELYGVPFLNRLNGMFAFGYFNKKQNELLLVRDRFGVKPLYYSVVNQILYFSSEIKPLLMLCSTNQFDREVLEAFTVDTATDFNEHSPYKDILQVRAGHYLSVSSRGVVEHAWYHGTDFAFDQAIFKNHTNTVSFVEDLITDAIRLRLVSDVPVCITLSGGLDSTVIYTLLHERLHASIQPFTLTHPKADSDELAAAQALAREYGEEVITVVAQPQDPLKAIEQALYYLEFPIWDSSAIAYFEMYQAIHEKKFKVVIEGHGSDEQLGGYQHLVLSGFNELLCTGRVLQAVRLLPMMAQFERFPGSVARFCYHALKQFIKNPERNLRDNLENAFHYKILPIVLRTFDRLPMAHAVESRSPFLDYRLVEVFKKMPLRYKISPLGSKAILREILKRYKKSAIYENKTKRGFGLAQELIPDWKKRSLDITKSLFSIST